MSEGVTLERLQKFLMSNFDLSPSQVLPSARLVDDLELDSLDAVDLCVRLEQETGIEISEDDLKGLETVEDILVLIRRKLPGSA